MPSTLTLRRLYRKAAYTIGRLYIDGKPFCDTLEPTDRGLTTAMTLAEIRARKVKGKTAIPTGTYRVTLSYQSPRFRRDEWYCRHLNNACVPRLINIPGFIGVLIHAGNTPQNTEGCILVGNNTTPGRLTASRATLKILYNLLQQKAKTSTSLYITIE